MESSADLLVIEKDGRSLRGLLNPCDGQCVFEVKAGERIVYSGSSFQKARKVYETVCKSGISTEPAAALRSA